MNLIAIADDHELFLDGICNIINSFRGCNIIIKANNGNELLDKLSTADILPNICILDIRMPILDGYKTLDGIKKKWPQIKVLILTMYVEKYVRQKITALGADGYLIKNSNPKELEVAINTIANGGAYFYNPEIKAITKKKDTKLIPNISEREMDFLKMCCTSMTYDEIATILKVSVRTVQSYQNSLSEKLGIKSRTQLAIFAKEIGLV